MVDMAKNVETMQVVAEIESWKNSNDVDKEIEVEDFMDKFGFMLETIQYHDYFEMYKSKAIYSIHYLSNKFTVPSFILSEYVKLYLWHWF